MRRLFTSLIILGLLFTSVPAHAENTSGKIFLVQVTSNGTRFFMQAQGLSLFTSNAEYRAVLLEAFFRKATCDIGYTKIACPGGITGTCGTVTFVSVNTTGLP